MQLSERFTRQQVRRAVIIGVVTMLAITLPFVGYAYLNFHVTGTSPETSKVGVYSPYLKVNFSQSLSGDSLQYTTSGGNFVTGAGVNGKTVTFTLNMNLTADKKYTITIQKISNTSGKTLTNKVFAFTAQQLEFGQLSKDEQAHLNKEQDNYPYSVGSITYDGFDTLTDTGLSASQLITVKSALFAMSKAVNEQFWKITLKQDSVYPGPPADTSTLDFDYVANNTTYHAKVTYSGFDDPTTVVTNTTGQELYRDSPEVIDPEE